MATLPQCPTCGCEMAFDFPSGLCPDCLFAAGLNDDDGGNDGASSAEAGLLVVKTPPAGGFVPPLPTLLAKHFPQLEILALLGQGGMGAVYTARQKKLDRLVALKIIRPESANDPAFAERFNREARTLARLSHPGIVAVHDFGEVVMSQSDLGEETPSALYYFVMEFVDGANLRHLIAGGDLSAVQSLAIIPQICDALQFAHEAGVVHRDIKPENILLDRSGRVKIADFGLAKLASGSELDFTLTGTHQVMGTPLYMAPEQMEGSNTVDHRADIYSLGVVFYEMLTGHLPLGQFDPPSQQIEVDARLDKVVLRALAREPDRRYQHAGEISEQVNLIRGIYSSEALQSIQELGGVWPGVSTIFEGAVGKVAGGVRPRAIRRFFAAPAVPGVAAAILSVIGFLLAFIPWANNTRHSNSHGLHRFGYDHSISVIVTVVFFVLALAMIVGTTSRKRPWWRPWIIFLASVTSFCFVLLYADVCLDRTDANPSVGFLMALGISMALMIVGTWDLKYWLQRRPSTERHNSLQQAISAAGRAVPYSASTSPSTISRNTGRDWVSLTRQQVETELLPDVCMVCGVPAFERVNHTFTDYGMCKRVGDYGFMRTTRMRIPCSVCPKHRRHWRRLLKWAISGLIGVSLLTVVTFMILADAYWNDPDVVVGGTITVGTLAVILWISAILYIACTRVSAESITDQHIKLQRVSPEFVAAVLQKWPENASAASTG
ncbi:Serine/threonine-protein kinase PknB [Symmachiella macrocystis]|uniref:Serine/threonine-protein kinase PknB n=1 Tax=Symmachiella macrocystis TaxID=2527985 RepID=A0A5C6BJ95_9PLAN|nr:serine/threonine-protein kinase [Symmachiella macrocystis]TWU11416.1 Serine/threonine-protein kinase PknB [Symmachiella macrocystis]